MRAFPKKPRVLDVMVTDTVCERCGYRSGKWWIDDKVFDLPVAEESAFVRHVTKNATHNDCGGSILIATQPLTKPSADERAAE